MMSKATALIGIVLCASLLGAQGVSAGEKDSGGDIFRFYEANVHARAEGVYELGDWVFFHHRAKVRARDRFAKLAAMKKATETTAKKVFAWIDSHGGNHANQMSSSVATMRRNGIEFASDKTVVRRSLSSLPSRVLYRDVDSSNPDEYVLDLCVRKADLLAEAKRGRFDTREDVVVRQWGNVVQEQLASTNQMAFIRAVGAFDLWTINSEFTSGFNELQLTNGIEAACCAKCIAELVRCTSQVHSDAAREYGEFLGGFQEKLGAELRPFVNSNECLRVQVMLMSYASCLVSRQDFPDSAVEVVGKYAGQTEPAEDSIRAMFPVLESAPGAVDCWQILGCAAVRGEAYRLALACFRNQIRLGDRNPELFDRMAAAYAKLGYRELAKGAAMIAYGLSANTESIPESCRILERK